MSFAEDEKIGIIVISPHFRRQQFPQGRRRRLRSDAVEIRDVLAGFDKPGDALVLGTMLFGHECGILDAAAVTDLGGARIALEQERLWAAASGGREHRDQDKGDRSSFHDKEATRPDLNGKSGKAE